MKNIYIICLNLLLMTFIGCEGMATLFHGPKPEKEIPIYTITFNANDATGIAPEAQTVNEGTAIILPSEDGLSFLGKVFTGWCVNPGGTGTIYAIGYFFSVTANQTLYARWENEGGIQQYTVTYNVNGGSGSVPTSQTVFTGTSIIVGNGNSLSKSGYAFSGWNTNAIGTGINYDTGVSLTVTGNVTLWARWVSTGGGTTTTGITVSPANVTVEKGKTQKFTVSINGTGNPSQSVIWSVEGGSVGTSVHSITGVLSVAVDEITETLTVRATSSVDLEKSGTASVTLKETVTNGSYANTIWEYTSSQYGYNTVTINENTVTLAGNWFVSSGEYRFLSGSIVGVYRSTVSSGIGVQEKITFVYEETEYTLANISDSELYILTKNYNTCLFTKHQ
ncbi:InlB B-repeat-containing protein [Treponema primitia]|uniref:InlB B-repeat-containing protein n=1 Tax=Treponema primitia TaxID=88058 RepID=UPI0002554C4A|nr:InlB B-repeat-containing protein [Treponema primitia]